jgi:6-phosphogluconolactonase (cycloisomerase 2 family)
MKLSRIGRISMALVVSVAMGLGMTACGGGTIGFMWVLGTQFNQIAAFKIDDFTGNLTTTPGSPFTSGGTDPVSLVVRTGGRYLYVINQGTPLKADANGVVTCSAGTGGGNIAEFAIGGQGVLTYQQTFTSQGCTPVWASKDATGGFLYVLDKYAPNAKCLANGQAAPVSGNAPANTCNGEITVFSSDSTTGRLSLVVNQQNKDPLTGLQLTYFPVGVFPKMLNTAGSCVFSLNQDQALSPVGHQTVSPYAVGTNGQLTFTTNTTVDTTAQRATSIISNGAAVYITDAYSPTSPSGRILPFTVSATACGLSPVVGATIDNLSPAVNPVYALVDSKNQFLYVANQSSTNSTNANSSISAFVFQSNGQFSQISDPPNNPYPIGGGPVCMVEDPSNQYIYTSNGDGTVTGKILDHNKGELSNLTRGSTFTAVGQATCLAVSGSVD